MSKRSEVPDEWRTIRAGLLGLGERSARRSHYPELQQRLAELERFRFLLDHSEDGILLAEIPSGRVVDFSRSFCRLTGLDAERLRGSRLQDLVAPEAAPAIEAFLAEEPAGRERSVRVETYLAGRIPTEMNLVASELEGAAYAVAVARDVTGRLQMEEELRLAQKMESVGRLAGGIAHDFNNILGVITGYSDLLLAQLGDQEALRRDVAEMATAARRGAELTRQLLAFSRRQPIEARVLDVNEVVVGLERMLRRVIGEDVRLSTRLEEGAWHVEADRGQLEQVLMNLAVNSRDAMPKGGELLVQTHNAQLSEADAARYGADGPGPHLRLDVTDTGCGMDAATRLRVFDPFFTTKEKGKGTGLGLSTVYGIVRRTGGGIGLRSAPGQGTTISILLPRASRLDQAPGASESAPPGPGHETVLLVEDESMLRTMISRMLKAHGYDVVEAASGAEALRLWEAKPSAIDLILTDVVMPGMSGVELATRLAAAEPGLKVLFMSGYTDEEPGRRSLQDRGYAVLDKPFSSATLAARIRELLDR